MGIPVSVPVADRIRELQAEAQRLLLMGEASAAVPLQDQARQLEVTDLSTAQQLAGHARPHTTAGYDRRPEATRRRAAAMLHVPDVPPRAA